MKPLFPFTIFAFNDWVQRTKPSQLELSDKEYALLCSYLSKNVREYGGIPIVFVDAPQSAV